MVYNLCQRQLIDRYVFSANFFQFHSRDTKCIQRETWYIGPSAGVDYSITSPYVDSRVDSNTCTTVNPLFPDSTLSPSQGLRIWPRCRSADLSPRRATKNRLAQQIKTLFGSVFFRHVPKYRCGARVIEVKKKW